MAEPTEREYNAEDIAKVVATAVHEGRITGLGDVAPLLIEECDIEEADALAIGEAVALKWQDRFFPPITRLELFVTENCNLRCDYCFVEGKNAYHVMSTETALAGVDFLFRESRDQKELAIMFMGGEPFMQGDLIREVTLYAEKRAAAEEKQVSFSTTTNGTLFDEEMLAFCQAHRISFLLSLDGDAETHDRHRVTATGRGSYEMIEKRIPLMKKYQPYMGVRMTVQRDAVGEIAQNFEHLLSVGANHFIIGPATGIEWSEDELDVYEQQMYQVVDRVREGRERGETVQVELLRELDTLYDKPGIWGCQAGRHSMTIAANGDIYACSKMLGVDDLKGMYRLGDLEHGITEIDARAQLVGMWAKRNTICMECDMRDACAGGCFATNYSATGSAFDPDVTQCSVLRHNFRVREYAGDVLPRQPTQEGEAPSETPSDAAQAEDDAQGEGA